MTDFPATLASGEETALTNNQATGCGSAKLLLEDLVGRAIAEFRYVTGAEVARLSPATYQVNVNGERFFVRVSTQLKDWRSHPGAVL